LHPLYHSLTIANTELHLLPQNAIYWPQENALLVADLHLGKEHVFSRRGVAIPEGPSNNTLNKLSDLLNQTGASHCIVLGDFFHDVPLSNDSWLQQLSSFLDKHTQVMVHVTTGNHDKKKGQAMIDKRIEWHHAAVRFGSLVLQHEPGFDDQGHVLAGHIHPVVSIGQTFQRPIKSRCFWHQPHCTVLPAFGDFTGGFRVSPATTDQVFLSGNERVIPIPYAAMNPPKRRPSKPLS